MLCFRSKLFLGLFLGMALQSQARADFNDSVFISISPRFPTDTSLELMAENANDEPSYCSLRVEAAYTLPSTPETKRHLLLKTHFFIPAHETLSGIEFGRDEFQNLGIPGATYTDATLITKSCFIAPVLTYSHFTGNEYLLISINAPEVKVENKRMDSVKPIRTCTGKMDHASTEALIKLLAENATQTFSESYGFPSVPINLSTLSWNAHPQQIRVFWNRPPLGLTTFKVPKSVKDFVEAIAAYQSKATSCTTEAE